LRALASRRICEVAEVTLLGVPEGKNHALEN
jgi:hypothetical protein